MSLLFVYCGFIIHNHRQFRAGLDNRIFKEQKKNLKVDPT